MVVGRNSIGLGYTRPPAVQPLLAGSILRRHVPEEGALGGPRVGTAPCAVIVRRV